MDLQTPFFPALFPLLLFIFMVFLILKSSRSKKLPPGPWRLPLIGNIHNLLGSLPHLKLDELANKYGPIMCLKLGEVETIIVSSPELAKEIMKTHDVSFATRPFSLPANIISYNASDITFQQYSDRWRQVRKVCMLEVLSSKRVQSFRPLREKEMLNLIRSISSQIGSEISLREILFSYTYTVISKAAFGQMRKEQEAFLPYIQDINEAFEGFNIFDLYPSLTFLHGLGGLKGRIERLHLKLDNILESIINDHQAKRKMQNNITDQDDLVDVLMKLHEQEENLGFAFTRDNVKAIILDIFLAGGEAPSIVPEWAISEMMKKPEVMKKAQEEVRQVFDKKGYVDEADLGELSYLKLVIKETLRLHPPLPLLVPRECREDCEINGYKIPVKSKVLIHAWKIARDPNYWNQPEKFIPERFADGAVDYKGTNFEFLPFGAGRRMCPGLTFGLVNVEFPLANLLYYFDWTLPAGMKPDDIDMEEGPGIAIKRKNILNLVPTVSRSFSVVA